MNKLLKKGLAIIGLLMVAVVSFTGCALVEEHAVVEFTFGRETHTLLEGWQAVGVVALLLAVIGAVIAIVIVVRKKKEKK